MFELNAINMKLPPAKPQALIEKLIRELSLVARPEEVWQSGSDFLPIDESNAMWVLMLLEGKIDIWRQHDNLLVVTLTAPFILGLQGSTFRYNGHYFKTSAPGKVRIIEQNVALKHLEQHNLMMDVIKYQSYINDHLAYLDTIMVNSTAYQMVCMRLIELTSVPDFQKIYVCDYILKRTHLARSRVMKLLSELSFGGYIDTHQGKLIALLKPFPKKF